MYAPRGRGGGTGQSSYTFLLRVTCKKGGGGLNSMSICVHTKWKVSYQYSDPRSISQDIAMKEGSETMLSK